MLSASSATGSQAGSPGRAIVALSIALSLAVTALCIVQFATSAPAPANSPMDVFTWPSMRTPHSPPYPAVERASGREGWVVLSLMVDSAGTPREITVADSTGNENFERIAERWMESQSFEPAKLGDVAVEARLDFKVIFSLNEQPDNVGARLSFRQGYNAVRDAVTKGDRTAADAALQSMKVQTLYEDAFYNYSRFYYMQRWGTKEEQVDALNAAMAHERTSGYLPRNAFRAVLRALFSLQIETGDLRSALDTYEKFDADTRINPDIVKAVAAIRNLETSARAYAVDGEIKRRDAWNFRLLKRRFSVDVLSGKLSEIKLRCDRKYVFFHYQADMEYTVSDSAGACNLQLIGQPGTKFKLIQS